MSHKSNFSLSSINFATDLFFRVVLPLYYSRDIWKKKLKSPAKTIFLSYKSLIVSNISWRSWRIATWSISVLGLYILTIPKLDSSTLTSHIKIRPFSSIFLVQDVEYITSYISNLYSTRVHFIIWKKIGLFNSSAHFFSPAKDEWVSCKSKNLNWIH